MFANKSRAIVATFSLAVIVFLAGCSQLGKDNVRPAGVPSTATGLIRGGQQPITSATIQLYQIGTTGDGSAAKPILTGTVTTSDGSGLSAAQGDTNANAGNANNTLPAGFFTITNLYQCDSTSNYVYLVATGGNPGLSSGATNSKIQLVAYLGQCGSLSSSTFANIDEVTTVATIAALQPYITSVSSIGYNAATDAAAFTTALNTLSEYVNIANGVAPGPALPANMYASSNEINALADILASCINTNGDTSTSSTPCSQLFSNTTPPSSSAPGSTFAAALNIINNPNMNVGTLYTLIPSDAPFQPVPSTAPANWKIAIVPIVVAPSFSPPAGSYSPSTYPFVVNATSTTAGTTIYCTLDGSTPNTSSQVEDQSQGIPIGAGITTLQCYATASGDKDSSVTSGTYNIKPLAPVFPDPTGSTYPSGFQVPITASSGTIHYTTNGSTPTQFSTTYTSPIVLTKTTTIKAVVYSNSGTSGGLLSDVVSATYSIQ